MALLYGADIVFEFPMPFCSASAQKFARSGVSLLNSLGVDFISFGSESGNLNELLAAKDALLKIEKNEILQTGLKQGKNFAKARQEAAEIATGTELKILKSPNNILATEYLHALDFFNSKIQPVTIKRAGTGHDARETKDDFASASYIRQNLDSEISFESFVPPYATGIMLEEIAAGRAPAMLKNLEKAILAVLYKIDTQQLAAVPEISEGLEHRIKKSLSGAKGIEELFECIKSKRYTMSRVRRCVLWAFLGVSEELLPERVPYAAVLGFNKRGRAFLKSKSKATEIPIIIKPGNADKQLDSAALKIFEFNSFCSDIYSLACPEIQPGGRHLKTSPVYIED